MIHLTYAALYDGELTFDSVLTAARGWGAARAALREYTIGHELHAQPHARAASRAAAAADEPAKLIRAARAAVWRQTQTQTQTRWPGLAACGGLRRQLSRGTAAAAAQYVLTAARDAGAGHPYR